MGDIRYYFAWNVTVRKLVSLGTWTLFRRTLIDAKNEAEAIEKAKEMMADVKAKFKDGKGIVVEDFHVEKIFHPFIPLEEEVKEESV